ncbi:MAG: hypothetical protein AMXMBFR64_24620 [Myxococcales bacterium]
MRRAIAALAVLLVMGSARADEAPEVEGDPHGGSGTWLQPRPAEQAERDPALDPAGKGAIFVPAMTDPLVEPAYIVMRRDKVVARKQPGERAWVLPGEYTVLVGSGVPEARLEFEATVVEGRTTFVPVEWAGLVVNVINERGSSIRRSYELVHLPDFEYVGIGLGAEIAEGEQLRTWLLRPGRYMILGEGESYQARKNFFTLRLAPGELVRYTLVVNEETGDLQGAGEVLIGGDATETTSGWNIDLVLGGSVQFLRSDNVVGKGSASTVNLSAFVETLLRYNDPEHLAYFRLNIEEGGDITLPDAPYIATTDELELDLLYVYKVTDWFGPYVRAALETNLVPGYEKLDSPRDTVKLDTDGTVIDTEKEAESVELAGPASPIEVWYGAGGRFTWSPDYWFDLSTRIGVGGRQVFTRDLFVQVDDSDTPELELHRVPDVGQVGIEAAVVLDVLATRYVALNVEFDMLEPFDAWDEPVISLRTTVALRIASFASLNYVLRVKDDPALSPDTQIDQAVQLRFAWKAL